MAVIFIRGAKAPSLCIFRFVSSFMLKQFVVATCAMLISASLIAAEVPRVLLQTNKGDVELELNPEKAPVSVKNFLSYVESGFYNGVIFHRVIPGFMIQGGGFTQEMQQKTTNAPIRNEANNGLTNQRGTLAMARTNVVDSATSQFFINLKDNEFLNHGQRDYGYAVFGRVVKGMEVVDQIANLPTKRAGMHQNAPAEPVIIQSAKQIK